GAAETSRRLAGRRQPAQTVLEHRSRGRRVRRGEEGQDEDVAVPEDVAAVGGTGEAARADSRLAVVRDRGHEMEEGDSNRELEVGIAFDDHVRLLPASRPALAVLAKQALESR